MFSAIQSSDQGYLSRYIVIKIKGVYLNNKLYWIKVRIPVDLQSHFGGKKYLNKSLGTPDKAVADKLAIGVLKEWSKDFERLSRGGIAIPSDEAIEAVKTAYSDPDLLVEEAIGRLEEEALRRAGGDPKKAQGIYAKLSGSSVLKPEEKAYLIEEGYLPDEVSLLDALRIYLKTHPKGIQKIEKVSKLAMQGLIDSIGNDLPLNKLKRAHISDWVAHSLEQGHKTTTVKRRFNSLRAILNKASTELEIDLRRVIEGITIPSLGKDSETRYSPNRQEIKELLKSFKDDPLMILLVLYGGRVGELAGLKREDVFLNKATPYFSIKSNEVRSLKTANSERDFPLVGKALAAMKKLLATSDKKEMGLLPQYFRARGADTLSATLNKRLKARGFEKMTTHSMRHGMKDLLLREANLPEHLVNELQGHGSASISRSYGFGPAMKMKEDALKKAYKLIGAL